MLRESPSPVRARGQIVRIKEHGHIGMQQVPQFFRALRVGAGMRDEEGEGRL